MPGDTIAPLLTAGCAVLVTSPGSHHVAEVMVSTPCTASVDEITPSTRDEVKFSTMLRSPRIPLWKSPRREISFNAHTESPACTAVTSKFASFVAWLVGCV